MSDGRYSAESITAMIGQYEAAGLGSTREVSFLRSCESMIRSRGWVTSNMERWLIGIMDRGGPNAVSKESLDLAADLETSLADAGTKRDFLADMISSLRAGKTLTPRQIKAVFAVHDSVKSCREKGNMELTPGEVRAMKLAALVVRGYSHGYVNARPGSFMRASAIVDKFVNEGRINRVDWDDISSVVARLREIAYPKHAAGDLLYIKGSESAVVVLEEVSVSTNGDVGHVVLHDGKQVFVSLDRLRTRISRAA